MSFIKYFDVLPNDLMQELLRFAFDDSNFSPAGLYAQPGANPHLFRRASQVLEFGPLAEEVKTYIARYFPHAVEQIGMAPYKTDCIEVHMTRYGHGDFFAAHTDTGLPGLEKRQLAYCLYFHRQPKAFQGGELRIYKGAGYRDIEPAHNSLVFFDGRLLHEVLPVTCESRSIAGGRFTVNGFIWRDE